KAVKRLREPLEQLSAKRGETRSGRQADELLLAVQNDITNDIEPADGPPYELKPALDQLERDTLRARQQFDWLPPPAPPRGQPSAISDLSGPSANEVPAQLRYDEQGRPQLPAENASYLGRSLFTDYLLPVELGGFLLLVAVVGS